MSEPTTSSTLGAREIARDIAAGELSAREAVAEHVRRIEEANPRLNAVVVLLFDHALGEADAADAARSRGEPLGPLHGVPVTIKEQFLVIDTPTTVGLPSRALHRAAGDGPLVSRLRQAGRSSWKD
jgi:Asp-tRNA(Asn)/Glu-tRNA(Gln) amidotransferase A subunit family amidase